MASADLIVIGAGPAGCAAAAAAALQGLKVLLLEKARLPRSKLCAGGVSPRCRRALSALGVWSQVEREGYPVEGARITAPWGGAFTLRGPSSAVVLARSRLDSLLAGAALRAGAELRDGVEVESLLMGDGRVCGVHAGGRRLPAGFVVAADGSRCRFGAGRRWRRLTLACMARFRGIAFTPHLVELFFDRLVTPHYGWLFPESAETVNVGLSVSPGRLAGRRLSFLFQEFLDRALGERMAKAEILEPLRSHLISASGRVAHPAWPGSLLAGEACGLVNPLTGEGIYYALESGLVAAGVVARALEEGWKPEQAAKRYLARLRRRLEPSLRLAEMLRGPGRRILKGAARLASWRTVQRLTYRALVGRVR